MQIVVVADIHGKVSAIDAKAEVLSAADLVVVAGDITHFGHAAEARHVIEAIERYCDNVVAVSGNCDHPDVEAYLQDEGIGLEGVLYDLDDLIITGLSGSLPCPHPTPNEFREADFAKLLQDAELDLRRQSKPLMLVSHHPPVDSGLDSTHNGSHVGSFAVRGFLQRAKPALCMCGHIHEARGETMLGVTRVINPGPLVDGGYALVTATAAGVEAVFHRPPSFRIAKNLLRPENP